MVIKRLAVCAFLAISSLGFIATAQESQSWQPTLDAARKTAAQSNRLVLIYFQADWCKACRAMERDTLSQPAVVQNLQANYAMVKVNADFLPMTAKQYGVTLLPTTVITTADGQMVDKMTGAMEAQQFVGRLGQVAAVARRQGMSTLAQVPGAGTQPLAQGGPAIMRNSPAYGSSPVAASTPVAAPAPVAAGIPQNAPQPAVDRYADYNRFYGNPPVGQPAMPPAAQPAAPGVDPRVGPTAAAPAIGPGLVSAGGGSMGPGPMSGLPGTPVAPAAPVAVAAPSGGFAAGMGGGAPAAGPGVPTGIAPASPAVPTPMDAANPPLGLDGYCPVALAEKRIWQPGDRRWGLVHRGRTYLFSGEAERDRFNADPDAYAPVMSGVDVVLAFDQGKQVPGRRECGVFCGKKVYLFADEASLKKFEQNQAFYTNQVLQAMRSGAVGGGIYR